MNTINIIGSSYHTIFTVFCDTTFLSTNKLRIGFSAEMGGQGHDIMIIPL